MAHVKLVFYNNKKKRNKKKFKKQLKSQEKLHDYFV